MSKRSFFLIVICLQLCFVLTASGEATFSNDVVISDDSVNFIILENYSGVDAEVLRSGLDVNGDGSVNSSEVDDFVDLFLDGRKYQYLGYILLDNDEMALSLGSFNMEFNDAEGNVNTSDMSVKVSVDYRMNNSLTKGDHNLWVLGHPSISDMKVTLPEGALLLSYDGIESPVIGSEGRKVVIEGSSGIRSFMVDDRLTYEYAVSIDFRISQFIADLSVFDNFFSTHHFL
ncbi:hypothetical protein [Methanolobus sp. WCC4]|uniref:hypothetical protein n=1 Tax=Methanolobus sp. WCC4 TaxID=3125784 RepID=UPI0030F9348B